VTYDYELRRQTPLAAKLKERIRESGPIPVSEYMSNCLWDETSGYYATRDGIGAGGDFITAAEISQVFGELIGLWAAVVWKEALGAPEAVRIVEYGPGRGTMMRDIIRAGRVVPGFREAARVHLVEMSPMLAATQRATLEGLPVPVTWGQNLVGFETPAIILANEFLDAWPAEQWVRTPNGWFRRAVGLDASGELNYCLLEAEAPPDLLQRFHDAPPGAIVESQQPKRFAEAFQALARTGPVAALIIDYGYATATAGDTLQAVRGHKYEFPLTSPGEADISAHVSFYELASVLHQAGLAIDGPLTQAEFLGALGIVERTTRLMQANPERAGEIETGVARIVAPNGMGGLFKVIGVRSPDLPQLPGFGS
jgi:NADH dehydrogenase [ubiquinone] 1 alpha subcomplex assembly factor 7